MPSVRLEGMSKLERKLGSLRNLKRVYIKPAMRESMNYIHSTIPPYPPPRRAKMTFKSERQIRWFFWALNEGIIDVPYRRTMTLGRKITTAVNDAGGQVVGSIGTNDEKAPWVISREETPEGLGPQADYHKDHWWTLQDVVEEGMPTVHSIFKRHLRELLAQE